MTDETSKIEALENSLELVPNTLPIPLLVQIMRVIEIARRKLEAEKQKPQETKLKWINPATGEEIYNPETFTSDWGPFAPHKTPDVQPDPDEWVTQDRVPDRPGIDEWRWEYGTRCIEWIPSNQTLSRMHGEISAGATFAVRCRRKDLPQPSPQVKQVPIRLWVHRDSRNDDRYNVFAKITEPEPRELYNEVKPDGKGGFCVEVTQ